VTAAPEWPSRTCSPEKIIDAVGTHTEAHPAHILLQYLATYGARSQQRPLADNRNHPARMNPFTVGKTSLGAKRTS
jgi:hypothetical protein